jgi:DHA2 family multidrug resistance protein
VSAKAIITVGTLCFCYAMWLHNHFTTESGADDFFWPLVMRGFGLGLIFMPLNNLAMANMSVEDIGNASGIYNLTRMLGGSVGIATAATMFSTLQHSQRGYLLEHLSNNDGSTLLRLQQYQQWLLSKGYVGPVVQEKALALISLTVDKQAMMLTFAKLFLSFGILLACALPLLLLMKHRGFASNVELH